ncbi:roadblock/LC7 domain-containing protein [Kitasatospora sp. NPDC096077]|uniref:roadblock/LC7 domain-containing protein n=1 Tax=Kitasatospora sp. NPDC096077 TaxID=3155544 RepID=UPI00332CE941
MSSATERDLDWLLENLLAATPGTRHALVLSADGLKLCHTAGLSADQADQLSAIASGLQSLAHGASIEFGDGTGGVRQSMTEFHGGILCIVAAGEGAHLAVVTDDDADVGVVGHNMHGLIEQIGIHLSAPARAAAAEPGAETEAEAEADAVGGTGRGSAGI